MTPYFQQAPPIDCCIVLLTAPIPRSATPGSFLHSTNWHSNEHVLKEISSCIPQKNPLEKPRSCFLGVAWNNFLPLRGTEHLKTTHYLLSYYFQLIHASYACQLWPIRTELIPVSIAWSDKEYLDASPSQGYPPALSLPVPIYTPGWREALWEKSVLPKNTTQCPRPGLVPWPLDPESSTLTMRTLHLPPKFCKVPQKLLLRTLWDLTP